MTWDSAMTSHILQTKPRAKQRQKNCIHFGVRISIRNVSLMNSSPICSLKISKSSSRVSSYFVIIQPKKYHVFCLFFIFVHKPRDFKSCLVHFLHEIALSLILTVPWRCDKTVWKFLKYQKRICCCLWASNLNGYVVELLQKPETLDT